MAAFPSGVAVVTATGPGGAPRGMTCSSVASVAVEPATLLVCLRHGSPTLAAALATSGFAVNFLHAWARPAAQVFAASASATDRFRRVRWRQDPGSAGPHLLDDAHAVADCRVSRSVSVGDHTVVFGEVLRASLHGAQPPAPLLYGLRKYWSLVHDRRTAQPHDLIDSSIQ
jgi:flavin reductase (DIM6/NTAB) family NADH-FMN oxidoreductase RutF